MTLPPWVFKIVVFAVVLYVLGRIALSHIKEREV